MPDVSGPGFSERLFQLMALSSVPELEAYPGTLQLGRTAECPPQRVSETMSAMVVAVVLFC